MSNENNETSNAEMAKAEVAAGTFQTALAAMMEAYKAGGDDAISKLNEALAIAVASEESTAERNDESGYRKYELGEAINNFAHVMEQHADRLTDAHKQVIANLTGRPFCAVKPIKHDYSTEVIPYFKEHSEGFTPDMMAALDEFSLANDIEYCHGINTRDRYALNADEMCEIVKAFRMAEDGQFYKPYWCPDYIDTIDKMKAFVFAYLTDINYHSVRKILEGHGVDEFAKVADLWLGAVEDVMAAEAKILGENA